MDTQTALAIEKLRNATAELTGCVIQIYSVLTALRYKDLEAPDKPDIDGEMRVLADKIKETIESLKQAAPNG